MLFDSLCAEFDKLDFEENNSKKLIFYNKEEEE